MLMTKYRNVKVKTLNNGTFDSKLEYKHFSDLSLMERAGAIKDLQRQVTIPLGASGRIKYRADFVFFDKQLNSLIVWDSKGMLTKEFLVKRAWLLESWDNFIFKQVGAKKLDIFKGEGVKHFDEFYNEYLTKQKRKEFKNENRAKKYARNSDNAKM